MPTAADQLHPVKTDYRQCTAKAQMTKVQVPVTIDMHPSAALRADAVDLRQIQCAMKAVFRPENA